MMLKKLALAAATLAASLSFTIATVHADGALCGPGSIQACFALPPLRLHRLTSET
jgi:hypothetical protein